MSDPIEPPLVTTQSPIAGTPEAAGGTIDIQLGLGPNPTGFDPEQTVISQYANSPTILQMIDNFQTYFDPTANLLAFYNNIWNIDSAIGFGLDIWGRIIGVSRLVTIPAPSTFTFGFYNAVSPDDFAPFNQAPFASTSPPLTLTYPLPDAQYRTLLLVKAFANICKCTAPALNQMLNSLFAGRGRCYVQDPGRMFLNYVFEFDLTAVEYAILNQSGVPPRPAGVLVNIIQIDSENTFGFYGSGLQPFNQAPFAAGA
jgi:hypothetical protein